MTSIQRIAERVVTYLVDGCALSIALFEASRLEALINKYKDIAPERIQLLAQIDPTTVENPENPGELKKIGGYTDWIIRQYLKIKSAADRTRFVSEDAERLRNDLTTYHRHKGKLEAKFRDINQVPGEVGLHALIEPLRQGEEETAVADGKAKKIYSDGKFTIVVPLDEAAACRYGAGTRWCTAATGGRNYFEQYNNQGPMFIIIQKGEDGDTKWQLHPDSGQYMDEDDSPVSLRGFKKILPEAARKAMVDYFMASDGSGTPDSSGNHAFVLALMPNNILADIQAGNTYLTGADSRDLIELFVSGQLDTESFNEVVARSCRSEKPPMVADDKLLWVMADPEDFLELFDTRRSNEEFLKDILAGDAGGQFNSDWAPDVRYLSDDMADTTTQLATRVAALGTNDLPEDGEVDWTEDEEVVTCIEHAWQSADDSASESAWQTMLIGDAVEELSGFKSYDWNGTSNTGFRFALASIHGELPKYADQDGESDWALGRISMIDFAQRLVSACRNANGDTGIDIGDPDRIKKIDTDLFNEIARDNLSNLRHERGGSEQEETPEAAPVPAEVQADDSLPDPNETVEAPVPTP